MTAAAKPIGLFTLAAVLWGALAFGAAYPWAYWPLAGLCAALGIWAIAESGGWREIRSADLARCLLLLAVAIALQLVPLPYGLFAGINPGADRFLHQYDFAYNVQTPSWHSLSISSSDTWIALGLFVAFAVFLLGLSRMIASIGGEWLVTRLTIVGVGLAFFAIVQRATLNPPPGEGGAAYGIWKSQQAQGRLMPFGPFFNRNHFAGWMILVTPLALGYFCSLLQTSWRDQGRRWDRWLIWLTRPDASRLALVGFCVLAMGTSLVLTGSRSGIAAFVVALFVLGYFIIRETSHRAGQIFAAVALIGLVVGAVSWAGAHNALGRFTSAGEDLPGRLAAWKDTARIIKHFSLFGTGMGTYGLAMLVYQTTDRAFIYFQAHNDYLQLLAEGGLLVGIPIAILLFVLVRSIWRQFDDGADDGVTRWIRAGAVASLIGIAAQSLVEFSLQMPGNTTLFVVVLAIAIHAADPYVKLKAAAQEHQRRRHAR